MGNQVRIEVWDNGVGIPEDKQAAIFEEFTRVEVGHSDQGLGLGLAIAKGIARVLGHEISLRSWHGQGTVFSVALNRSAQIEPQAAISAPANTSDVAGMKVLCVDNEADILVGMQGLLERWGCDVKVAEDLVQSLKALENDWAPEVIFSDYRLDHGRTGLEVLQQCRLRLGDSFEGVIISADRTDDMLDAIQSNGFSFIAKPVKPLKLRAVLNRVS